MNDKFSKIIKSTKIFLYDHSPAILTGIGITGMITATILAVKATPKALELIKAKKEELGYDELTSKEIVMTAWKPYVPSVITTLAAGACIIGACSINSKRNAALATAYTLSEKAFVTYRDQVIKTIGEKKEKKLRDEIAQENLNKKSLEKSQIIITKKGNTLCQDTISGRYFRSDLDQIKKVINELNRQLLINDTISLNEFYSALGLDSVKGGDDIGWSIQNGLIEPDFSACLSSDGEPCIVIDTNIKPFNGYDKYA
jgi:hypothetical protein